MLTYRVSRTFDDGIDFLTDGTELQRRPAQERGLLFHEQYAGAGGAGDVKLATDAARGPATSKKDRAGFTRARHDWILGRLWDRLGRCRKYGDITIDSLEKELSDIITISGLIFALAFGAPSWIADEKVSGDALCCDVAIDFASRDIGWGDMDWWVNFMFSAASFSTFGLSGITLAMAATLYIYLGKFHPEPNVDDEWLPRLFFIRFQRMFACLYILLFTVVFITSPTSCIALYMDKFPTRRWFFGGFAIIFWFLAVALLYPIMYNFKAFKRSIGTLDNDSDDEAEYSDTVPMSPLAGGANAIKAHDVTSGAALASVNNTLQQAHLPGADVDQPEVTEVEYFDGRGPAAAVNNNITGLADIGTGLTRPGGAYGNSDIKDRCPVPGDPYTRSPPRQALVEEMLSHAFSNAERVRLRQQLPGARFVWHEAGMYTAAERSLGAPLLAKLQVFVGSLYMWDILDCLMKNLSKRWAACQKSCDARGARRDMVRLSNTLRGLVAVKHPVRDGAGAAEVNARVYVLKIPSYAYLGVGGLESFPVAKLPGSFGPRDKLLLRVPYAGQKSSWRTDRVRVFGLLTENMVHSNVIEGNRDGFPSDDVVPRRLIFQLVSDRIDPSFLSRTHRDRLVALGLDEFGEKAKEPDRIGAGRGPFVNVVKGYMHRELKGYSEACARMLDGISVFWRKECMPLDSVLSNYE
eukprot:jgi/Mesvir1/27474/Mv07249-RA.1